jgi:NitT/TauT family transport system substrate-binding protein
MSSNPKVLPSRRRVLTLAALSGAAALAGLPVQAQTPEKKDVHIAVGGKASFYYLPLTIAEQLGYFREEGLNVKISDFAGGSTALQAVVGGSADVVSGAYEHVINLQAKKQIFTAFVLQGRAPQIAVGIAASRAESYRSPRDLKGLKIGVSAPGSSTNMVVNYLLGREGLKPSDVSIIGVGTAAGAVAAFRAGQIDAISNIEPVMTRLEQAGGIRIIADARTMKGTEQIFGGPMPAACLYAPAEFIQRNPVTTQALANAIVRADQWIQRASPQDVLRTVPESYLGGDKALYLFAFNRVREAFSPDGLFTEAGVKTTLKVLPTFNREVDPAAIALDRTWTNTFARAANARFR